MAHRRAKLTVAGRELVVRRIVEGGWPAVRVAEAMGISRATAYKWLARFRTEGQPGLEDRSSRPRRSPRRLSSDQVNRILAAWVHFYNSRRTHTALGGRAPLTVVNNVCGNYS